MKIANTIQQDHHSRFGATATYAPICLTTVSLGTCLIPGALGLLLPTMNDGTRPRTATNGTFTRQHLGRHIELVEVRIGPEYSSPLREASYGCPYTGNVDVAIFNKDSLDLSLFESVE